MDTIIQQNCILPLRLFSDINTTLIRLHAVQQENLQYNGLFVGDIVDDCISKQTFLSDANRSTITRVRVKFN
jgi:hypothetical protein